MSTIIKAAAVQISPVLYSRQGTIEKVVKKIRELGQQGVQFATFPETIVPYYPYFSFIQAPMQNIVGPEQRKLLDQAVTVPSPAADAIGKAAKQAGVVVSIGVNERDGGTLYNTQLLFDADGTLMQRRRKISPNYHERMIWGQGKQQSLWPSPIFRSRHPTNIQFMVKDTKKYAKTGGWGFAHFQDGKPGDDALMKTCFACHNEIKSRDLVFTRYAQ